MQSEQARISAIIAALKDKLAECPRMSSVEELPLEICASGDRLLAQAKMRVDLPGGLSFILSCVVLPDFDASYFEASVMGFVVQAPSYSDLGPLVLQTVNDCRTLLQGEFG